jgi:hypothetical protein
LLLPDPSAPQPPVYPSTIEVNYVAALKKADVEGQVVRLENEIDQLKFALSKGKTPPWWTFSMCPVVEDDEPAILRAADVQLHKSMVLHMLR